MRVTGVETEYGIDAAGSDVPAEVLSELVIRAVAPEADPAALSVAAAALGPDELAASRVIWNGGRAYVDHAHPEYSSPETASPTSLVAYDRAGDQLMRQAARRVSASTGLDLRLYRNTTDGKGASYGRHENYLVARALPWQRLVEVMTGFLVARVPLVGAGRVGLGQQGREPGYQISQRADFLVTPIGLQTTHDRPILNTRDEPHADPRRWRRLHVITGDPAWNQFQTWLSVGAAALVLAAAESGAQAPVRWADPVAALRSFSHDTSLAAAAETVAGDRLTCLDALELYLGACVRHVDREGEVLGPDTRPVLSGWAELLADLRRDVELAADRLDWVAKRRLLAGLAERTGGGWDDPRLAAVDLLWADLERSPALALAARGAVRTVVSDDEVLAAMSQPPPDTRAWLRGTLVRRFPDEVLSAGWDDLLVRRRGGVRQHLPMPQPMAYGRVEVPYAATAPDLETFLTSLGF